MANSSGNERSGFIQQARESGRASTRGVDARRVSRLMRVGVDAASKRQEMSKTGDFMSSSIRIDHDLPSRETLAGIHLYLRGSRGRGLGGAAKHAARQGETKITGLRIPERAASEM